MPYSKEYKEERYVEILSYTEKLENLREGEVLAISAPSLKELSHLHWLFRDYFHIVGAAGVYKCKLVGLNLLIGREISITSPVVLAKNSSLPFGIYYDNIMKRLITSPSPLEELCKAIKEENLSFSIISLLAGEYARTVE